MKNAGVSFYTEWYKKHEKAIFEDYFTLLRFPSVSAQPKHKKDVLACCEWVQNYLKKMGFSTTKWEGPGYPTVFAERIVDPKAPTVLIYGHYDVQPAEPFDLWKSNPFEPEIRKGRVYARGAEDNKGQNFYSITAVRAFIEKNPQMKLNIKFVIEGEEEMGSETLHAIVLKHAKELKADHLLVVDMGMNSFERPSLSVGGRGITTMQVTLRSMDTDVHSGGFGGIVYNPIRALTEVLAKVIDKKGHITIPGFYDAVKGLSAKEKGLFDLEFDEALCRKECGARAFHKEEGYSQLESNFLRPTFEVNGIWGGYTDDGFKTVIPKEAHAKISCRLVPDQMPEAVNKMVEKYIRDSVPKGMEVEMQFYGGGEACWASPLSKTAKIMQEAYREVFGNCYIISCGGSVPITKDLAKYSGAEFVLPGTAQDIDNIHAPNESFGLEQFEKGFLLIARSLELFAQKSQS